MKTKPYALAGAAVLADGSVWMDTEHGRCVLVTPPTRHNSAEVRRVISERELARDAALTAKELLRG